MNSIETPHPPKSKVKLPDGEPWTLKSEVLQPDEVWMVIGTHEETNDLCWTTVLAHTADIARAAARRADHQLGQMAVSEAMLNEMVVSIGKNPLAMIGHTAVDVGSMLTMSRPRYGVAFVRPNPKPGEAPIQAVWVWARGSAAAVQRAQRKLHTSAEPLGVISSVFLNKARDYLAAVRESGGVGACWDERWGDGWPARMRALNIEAGGGLDKYEERRNRQIRNLEAYQAAKAGGEQNG